MSSFIAYSAAFPRKSQWRIAELLLNYRCGDSAGFVQTHSPSFPFTPSKNRQAPESKIEYITGLTDRTSFLPYQTSQVTYFPSKITELSHQFETKKNRPLLGTNHCLQTL